MARVSDTSTVAWCDQKIITYDFCIPGFGGCYSASTSYSGIYNGKVYYVIPSTPTTYIWWNSSIFKWEFSAGLGVSGPLTLDYSGQYPYSPSVTWSGILSTGSYFKTCDCTCFTKPDYNPPNYLPVNECAVVTIYPMGVECFPIPPIKPNGKGSLTIKITGGTPPYIVRLINTNGNRLVTIPPVNSNSVTIPNLSPGNYFIEIRDQFGDFQQLINCTVPTPVPTPTPTPTPIPLPPYNGSYTEQVFCLTFEMYDNKNNNVPFSINFRLLSFTNIGTNIVPSYISYTNNEIIYWNTTISPNYWTLSASSSSLLVTNYLGPFNGSWNLFNTSTIQDGPNFGTWNYAGPTPTSFNYIVDRIVITNSFCTLPTLNFWINEGWWELWNSNIPNVYRGSTCGGGNLIPWFQWQVYNLPNTLTVVDYDLICVRFGTSVTNLNLTNIVPPTNPNFYFINSGTTLPMGTIVIPPTAPFGTANSQGWVGPCPVGLLGSNQYEVTLTAHLSDTTTLTASLYFIICTNVINGACYVN